MKPVTCSVVMPTYNEEGAIEAAVREVFDFVLPVVPAAELVVVNDGSRDGTRAILDRLAGESPQLRVIHQENSGHGPALRAGIDAAAGEYLLLVDSDRQMPLDDFRGLWGAARGRDGAFGIRSGRQDPAARLILTRVLRMVIRLSFGVWVQDSNVPLKLVRRVVWDDAARLIRPDSIVPSMLLAVFAARTGCDVALVPWPHRERATGVSSIRYWRLAKFCGRALAEVVAFRVRLGVRPAPTRAPAASRA